jgi:hypothetical protein
VRKEIYVTKAKQPRKNRRGEEKPQRCRTERLRVIGGVFCVMRCNVGGGREGTTMWTMNDRRGERSYDGWIFFCGRGAGELAMRVGGFVDFFTRVSGIQGLNRRTVA